MDSNTSGSLKDTFYQLLAPAYLPIFFLAFTWSSLAPAFPQYLSGLGVGVGVVGVVVAMKGIGQVASDVPSGFMLAHWGIRRVTIGSFLLAMAANVVLYWSRSVVLIAALTFASGFATSILITTVMTTVRLKVTGRNRGRALSGVGGAVRFGMLVGPITGGFIAEAFGVPSIFLLRVLVLFLGMSAFMQGTRPGDKAVGEVEPGVPIREPASARLRKGLQGHWYALITVGFVILLLSILRSSRELILPLWGETIGVSPATIGIAMGIGAAFDLFLFIPAGIISDRWGRKTAMALCLGVFGVGLVLLTPARTALLYIAAAALIGMGNGFGAGINMTTGADIAPDGAVSEFLGFWRLYGDIGVALGPIIVGALAAAITIGPAVMITAAIGFMGAIIAMTIAPETRDLRS